MTISFQGQCFTKAAPPAEFNSLERSILHSSLGPRLSPKNGGRREPGNIHVKSFRLPAPGSGGPNQIAEQNDVNT